jgi:hypothetical protein
MVYLPQHLGFDGNLLEEVIEDCSSNFVIVILAVNLPGRYKQ